MKLRTDFAQVDGPATPTGQLAARFAALGHPVRLSILRQLGQSCCCNKDVVGRLDLAQSTVSQHLRVLVAAGLVRVRQSGQRSVYTIETAVLAEMLAQMTELAPTCRPASPRRIADAAEVHDANHGTDEGMRAG